MFSVVVCLGLLAATSHVSAATPSFTTYQMEFRDVPLPEAQGVIDRTLGSGAVDIAEGQALLERLAGTPMQTATRNWFAQHPDAKVYG